MGPEEPHFDETNQSLLFPNVSENTAFNSEWVAGKRETAGEGVRGPWLRCRRELQGQHWPATKHRPPHPAHHHAHPKARPELLVGSLARGPPVGLRAAEAATPRRPGRAGWRRLAGRMAGAPGGGEPGPAAGEPLLQRSDSGQGSSEPPAQGKSQQGFLSSLFTRDQSCPLMLLKTLETSRNRDLEAGVGVTLDPGARKGLDPTDPGLHCSPRAAWAGGGVGSRPTRASEGPGWKSALLGHTH